VIPNAAVQAAEAQRILEIQQLVTAWLLTRELSSYFGVTS